MPIPPSSPMPAQSADDIATAASFVPLLRTISTPSPRTGLVIPGYEIERELGVGGMGVVYLARQTGLDRPVALKMLRAGVLAGEEARARFAEEARIVARLRHPNIVQLYECGEILDLPYVSLEYVEGPTLSRYLDETPQPAAWAAELVERLARAMQYAHEQGVIHRDLKPSNVLLAGTGRVNPEEVKQPDANWPATPYHSPTANLTSPTPKITDFGLAKILGHTPNHTETGFASGTPGYMAPEQVRGDREQIGPWTDVYALGVILYECLTGDVPFSRLDPMATMLATTTREPTAVRSLRPDVPRDLETVCLKCLAKNPEERYLTAAALAADLRRFRDGRAVLARRAGAAERAWKFVRRNPVVCGLGAALMASLVIGFATASVLYLRAEERREQADTRREQAEAAETAATKAKVRAEQAEIQALRNQEKANKAADEAKAAEGRATEAADEAKAARTRAEADRDKFKAINRFVLDDLIYAARPANQPGKSGRDATLREVILAASSLIEPRFREHPEVMASMDQTIGVILRHLGEYATAETHLGRAVAYHRKHTPPDNLPRLQAINSLAVVYLARDNMPSATAALREVIRAVEAVPAPSKDQKDLLLTARQNLGNALVQLGKGAEAATLLRQALADLEENDGPNSAYAISAAINLSRAYRLTGEQELALKTAWEAVARAERGPGPESPSAAGALRAVVDFQTDEPPSDAVVDVARRSAAVQAAAFGPDHPFTFSARQDHVVALRRAQRYGEMTQLLPELVQATRRRYGAGSDELRFAQTHLIVALGKQWRFAEALRIAEAAKVEAQKRPGPNNLDLPVYEEMIREITTDWTGKRQGAPAALGVPAAVPVLVGEGG